jgi:hypothetical protein
MQRRIRKCRRRRKHRQGYSTSERADGLHPGYRAWCGNIEVAGQKKAHVVQRNL